MTIVTSGTDEIIEQIIKQLNKLIDVVKVLDLNDGHHMERELMLVKVKTSKQCRDEVQQLSSSFGGRIIDASENILIIEFTGASTELDSYLKSLNNSLVVEIIRTGASGIGRGDRVLKI
jgi:acetolactate synthase-1/3 small subunit